MATNLDIIIDNQSNIKGPLTINLRLIDDKKPVEITLDGKTSFSSHNEPCKLKTYGRIVVIITAIIISLTLTILIGCIFANYIANNSGKENFSKETKPRIVNRDEWFARPESEPLTMLNSPVHRVIIAHTATSDCTSQAECSSQTQNIQAFHMESKQMGDIIYNFLVGGDGAVYEGRGWDKQGAHTYGYNSDTICIAFIGTFTQLQPTEGQLNAAQFLIAEGVRLNKISEDYRLYGARQFMGTESPGNSLYEIIRKWSHWSDKPY